MDYDNQKALKIFYELRTELQNTDETTKLKQLNQIISVLESSFFSKIVGIHKSLEAIKNQKNLKPEQIHVDSENGTLVIDKVNKDNRYRDESRQKIEVAVEKKPLPISQDDLIKRLKKLCGNKELIHVQLKKDNKSQSLGFSIKCAGSAQGNGIFIEEVTPGTVGERAGIQKYDQIVAVNQIPLDNPETNRENALQALKSNQMVFDMYFCRDKSKATLTPSKDQSHIRNRSDIGFPKELTTEWTQYEIIDLVSINGSFGFGIMSGLTNEVMVRNILSGGAADMDGRLQLDDHIMYINNVPVRHLGSNQVADLLKTHASEVKLIVARPFDQNSSAANSGKVQMVETSNLDARLEMIVNQLYPDSLYQSLNSNHESDPFGLNKSIDKYSGNDNSEFIQVDLVRPEKNLGMTLLSVLKQSDLDGVYVKDVVPGSVAERYNIKKFDQIVKINDEEIDMHKIEISVNDILNFSPMSFYIKRFTNGPSQERLMKMEEFSKQSNVLSSSHNYMKNINTPVLSDSNDESSVTEEELMDDHHQRKPLTLEEKLMLISKWKKRIDGNREIIIAEFSKFTEDGGLGISLEGTVDVEDNGLEVHPHHYIRSINANGPAGRNGFLKVKDELLEANDKRIYGLNHLDAVNVLKNLPLSVRIVVARAVPIDSNNFVGDDVSDEADRLCQDLDDIIARETGSGSLYSIKAKSQDNIDDWPFQEGKLSDEASRSRSLDQVHGLAMWDRQITYVDLEKRSNGLGFSVLDYQDPVDPQQSVIVIRSLVPNGAASKDGRIFPGDRLMSVNDIDVSQSNMSKAVDVLKKTEPGIVRLGIVKALCLESDNYGQDLTISDCNMYENVSSPRITDEIDNEANMEVSNLIPEALEHKIRLSKLAGQKLGIHLDSEGPYSNNENGFVVSAIDIGSPIYKSNRLSVGDYVTKINNSSLREATMTDVNNILKNLISYSDDIRISFIPETDYQVFMQSRTIQSNFKDTDINQVISNNETEAHSLGFFPKPSAIKASGGKLVFKNLNVDKKELMITNENSDFKSLNEWKPRCKVSSLVDLYDGCWGSEVSMSLTRADGNDKFGVEIVGE